MMGGLRGREKKEGVSLEWREQDDRSLLWEAEREGLLFCNRVWPRKPREDRWLYEEVLVVWWWWWWWEEERSRRSRC
jgi:hypothetical protein